MKETGASQRELARVWGVGESTVKDLVRAHSVMAGADQ